MGQSVSQDARQAAFHAKLRWVGAPLLLSGVVLLLWGLLSVLQGGPAWVIFLGMFGSGLGLASFGANHDTAMALALRARDAEGVDPLLSDSLSEELSEELEHSRSEVLAMRPSPRIATVIPLVALMAQGLLVWQLAGGVLS